MTSRFIQYVSFLILLNTSSTIYTENVDVSGSKTELIPFARILPEPEKNNIEKLWSLPFQKADKDQNIFSFGFTDTSYYFLISLSNPTKKELERILVFHPTWLDHIDVKWIEPDGHVQKFQLGDTLPFNNRSIMHQNMNLALTLKPGISNLEIRTKTRDPFLVQITLWEKSSFYQYDSWKKFYFGGIYSVIVVMILYNLIIFCSIKDNVYLSYVNYLFLFLVMNSTYNGFLFPLFWPESPVWENWANSVFIYGVLLAGLLFFISFLELKKRMIVYYRWSMGLIYLILFLFIFTALLGYKFHIRSALLLVLFHAPFVMFLGFLSLIKGNHSARYFFVATLAGFSGSLVSALTAIGLLKYTFISFHAVDAGMVIDAILLSLAMADRLRLAKAEAADARDKLLELSNRHTENLEMEVADRTAGLENFNRILAHDLRQPLGVFQGYLSILFEEKNLSNFARTAIENMRISAEGMNNLIKDVIELLRVKNMDLKFEEVDPIKTIQTIVNLNTIENGKKIHLEMSEMKTVFSQKALFYAIFRNLIGNSIKYNVNENVRIFVQYKFEQGNHIFFLKDNGIGIPHKDREEIFKPFKRAHANSKYSGSGVGLSIVKSAIERLKGNIKIIDNNEPGTIMCVTLPDYHRYN